MATDRPDHEGKTAKPAGPSLPQDEEALWMLAMRGVSPLKPPAPPSSSPPTPASRRAGRAKPSAPSPAAGDSPAHRAPAPAGKRDLQQQARGDDPPPHPARIAIEARIDLHGMTQRAAHEALTRFILDCHARDRKFLLVITGKGRKPDPHDPWAGDEPGILRRRVPEWLRAGVAGSLVRQIHPAAQRHGGAGAFYVLLRRKRPGRVSP